MRELLLELVKLSGIDIGHVVGWLITIIIAMFTLLYKGIWARIKQQDAENTLTKECLDRLIGAHNAMCALCGHGPIIERRTDPARPTIEGFTPETHGNDQY